jgi:hypothetical protein
MASKNLYPYVQKDVVLRSRRIGHIASSFPMVEEADRVSRELRWILNQKRTDDETIKALTNIFQTYLRSNMDADPDREAKEKFGKIQNWASKLRWILKSWWTGFEFFMVDALQRNRFHFKNTKLFHTKASPRLDYERKIDFLSTIVHEWNIVPKNLTVWVQLTTEKSHIRIYPDYREHMKKKKQIVHSLSEKCVDNQDPYMQQLPSKLKPNLTSYMVVNWSINKRINIDNDNVFLKAFQQREKNGFHNGWPWLYLPEQIQKELWIVYHAYQRSLKQFVEFLEVHNAWLPDSEQYTMTDHDDVYHLVSTYNPESKELQYKVFYNKDNKENVFLFYISYFLHDGLLQKT